MSDNSATDSATNPANDSGSLALEKGNHRSLDNHSKRVFPFGFGKETSTSMRDDLLRNPNGDYSFSVNKERSDDLSDKRVQSFVLWDKSNSELKNSCSSKYADYLDHFKKSFLQLIREDDEEGENDFDIEDGDESILEKNWRGQDSKVGEGQVDLNRSNILLNSTILSNCFNNLSFHPNTSKEVDFAEEDNPLDDSCSFISRIRGEGKPNENYHNPFSIIDEMDESSFSFGFNNKMCKILQELDRADLQDSQQKRNHSSDSLELILRKRVEHPKFPLTYDKKKEHLILSLKYLKDCSSASEYIVTRNGMVGSTKNTGTGFIVFGRQEEDPNGVRPNDVVLMSTDKSISRVHACLLFKHGFKERRLQKNFLTFLSGKRRKIGGLGCRIPDLPLSSLHTIYSFLRPSNKFYIADLGSASGTYKKLVYEKKHKLAKRDIILIGSSTQLHVRNIIIGTGSVCL